MDPRNWIYLGLVYLSDFLWKKKVESMNFESSQEIDGWIIVGCGKRDGNQCRPKELAPLLLHDRFLVDLMESVTFISWFRSRRPGVIPAAWTGARPRDVGKADAVMERLFCCLFCLFLELDSAALWSLASVLRQILLSFSPHASQEKRPVFNFYLRKRKRRKKMGPTLRSETVIVFWLISWNYSVDM